MSFTSTKAWTRKGILNQKCSRSWASRMSRRTCLRLLGGRKPKAFCIAQQHSKKRLPFITYTRGGKYILARESGMAFFPSRSSPSTSDGNCDRGIPMNIMSSPMSDVARQP